MQTNKNKPNPNYVPPASVSTQQAECVMSNDINFLRQGWECPKCGAVMGPHVDVCVNCRGNGSNLAITYDYDRPTGQDLFDVYIQAIQDGRITNKC